jgi:hypothetical protein
MRTFLLMSGPREGWLSCGVTLTIPGPLLSVEDSRIVWETFRVWCKDQGLSAVWRLEVQQRGAMHWHMLCNIPPDWKALPYYPADDSAVLCLLRRAWSKALEKVGPCTGEVQNRDGTTSLLTVSNRAHWIGADAHMVNVQVNDGRGNWLRYLQDHGTKAKQEQIAEGMGKHWGVINRALFLELLPDDVSNLDVKSFNAFLRAYQRLCTPSHKHPASPFGRRLRRRVRFGAMGKTVRFSNPETVKRLVAFYSSWSSSHPLPSRASERREASSELYPDQQSVNQALRVSTHLPKGVYDLSTE